MGLESGSVGNKKVTEYKVKDEGGKTHTERVEYDKGTKKIISRKLNGKEMNKEMNKEIDKEIDKSSQIPYQQSNGEFFIINRLDVLNNSLLMMINQLKEMNYYICKAYGDDEDKERVGKLLNNV